MEALLALVQILRRLVKGVAQLVDESQGIEVADVTLEMVEPVAHGHVKSSPVVVELSHEDLAFPSYQFSRR